jgi:hypothetical protein
MAPTIVAWVRRKSGKPMLGTLGFIALENFLIGWTVIGWFLALAMALNFNVVAPVAIRLAKMLGSSGLGGGGPVPQSDGSGSAGCYVCHGKGTVTKTALELSPMDAQNTMNQQRQMTREVPCSACGGSGRSR